MISLGLAIYAACVDFMLKLAAVFGMTYRDANALFFFVIWPVVTVLLFVWCVVERVLLLQAKAREEA